jgi:uncharacterized protein YjiS (DUF1127 family)
MYTSRTENRAQFGSLFDVFSPLMEAATHSLRSYAKARRIERDIKHVRNFSDGELNDIGISRENVEQVLRTGHKQK